VKGYLEKEDNQTVLAKELPHFVRITPSFPPTELHSCIASLLASANVSAKAKLVDAVLALPLESNGA
jgi:hypothetical protein